MPVPIAAGNHAGPIGASLVRAGRATAGLDGVATFFTQLSVLHDAGARQIGKRAPRRLALHRAGHEPAHEVLTQRNVDDQGRHRGEQRTGHRPAVVGHDRSVGKLVEC